MNRVFQRIACLTLAAAMFASFNITSVPAGAESAATETLTAEDELALREFQASRLPKVSITEIMTKNSASICTQSGRFSDWVELHNNSSETVDLTGWSLSCEDGSYQFPSVSLAPDAYLVVWANDEESTQSELHTGFSFSGSTVLSLLDRNQVSVDIVASPKMSADRSFSVNSYGEYRITAMITPGYPNSEAGYESFMSSRPAPSDLVINELMVSNVTQAKLPSGKFEDWVELENNTDSVLSLSGYYLSDDASDFTKWAFPDRMLNPGDRIVVYCDKKDCIDDNGYIHTCFGLNSSSDRLFVTGPNGLVDYVYIHDVPVNCSYGRRPDGIGFYYYNSPTPGTANTSPAYRTVSSQAVLLSEEGIFNNVNSVPVELSGSGTVYYTLDGSLPSVSSQVYTGPISLTSTAIVRAINVDEGSMPSEPVTASFIINENHALPVVSLVTDNHEQYLTMYNGCNKDMEVSGVFSLYEMDGRHVTNRCGIVLSGAGTVYSMPKKSLSALFRNKYGDGDLNYDVFDSGHTRYSGLTMRAGEAFCTSVIRSDLFQDLGYQIENFAAINQHSKHCIVYVDGQYFGMMTLKERFTEEYFADMTGVSDPDTVTIIKYPVQGSSDFYRDVIQYCLDNDMSTQENFDYFCSVVNINSFIDWIIVEGYSANPDIGDNLRLMMSTENGQWYFALYDLDWAFQTTDSCFENLIHGSDYNSTQMRYILEALMRNSTFIDLLSSRYAQVWNTVLSNENVLSMYDDYQAILDADIARDRDKWGNSYDVWIMHMDRLRNFVRDSDVQNAAMRHFCSTFRLTQEQISYYFGQ